MRKYWAFILATITFVVGLLIGASAYVIFPGRVDTQWRKLAVEGRYFGMSYATEVVFADLPLGDVTEVSGQAKFLDPISRTNEATELGYVVTVMMTDPDPQKLPERYRQTKTEIINGMTLQTPPLEHAVYEIMFEFTLRDRDNFELMQISSKGETFTTGTSNKFQQKLKAHVPYEVALKTATVELRPHLSRCVSCDP